MSEARDVTGAAGVRERSPPPVPVLGLQLILTYVTLHRAKPGDLIESLPLTGVFLEAPAPEVCG